MRTAEIFNGRELITVAENHSFRLDGVWNWDVGTVVTFQVKAGIEVKALVQVKDGLGTKFLVTEIVTADDIAETKVAAEEVEVEIVKNEVVEESKTEAEEKPKVSNRMTKREIIEFIATNDIDIDTKNKTKAEIISILSEMGYM